MVMLNSLSMSRTASFALQCAALLLGLLCPGMPLRAMAEDAPNVLDVSALVDGAMSDYEDGMAERDRSKRMSLFGASARKFEAAIAQLRQHGNRVSSDLWLAFGNASLESEKVGAAIFAYRNALAIAPGSNSAAQNLSFARARVSDGFANTQQPLLTDSLFFWRSVFSREQQFTIAAVLFAFAGLLLVVAVGLGRRLVMYLAAAPAVAWMILITAAITDRTNNQRVAVVLGDVEMRSADSDLSPPRLKEPLPDGAEVQLLQRREDWCEVESRGQSGWVKASQIGIVGSADSDASRINAPER